MTAVTILTLYGLRYSNHLFAINALHVMHRWFLRYIAKEMNLDEVKSGLHDWGSNNKYIALMYLYGSKVTGMYSENSDIDVAVEIDEGELEPHYSNAMSVWFSHKQSWTNELKKIVGVEVHLEWLHQEDTPTVKSGVEAGHILVYDKAI